MAGRASGRPTSRIGTGYALMQSQKGWRGSDEMLYELPYKYKDTKLMPSPAWPLRENEFLGTSNLLGFANQINYVTSIAMVRRIQKIQCKYKRLCRLELQPAVIASIPAYGGLRNHSD